MQRWRPQTYFLKLPQWLQHFTLKYMLSNKWSWECKLGYEKTQTEEWKVPNSFQNGEIPRLTLSQWWNSIAVYPTLLCLFWINSSLTSIADTIYQSAKQPDSHRRQTPIHFSSSCISLVHSSKTASCPRSPTGTNLFITPWILAPHPQCGDKDCFLHN